MPRDSPLTDHEQEYRKVLAVRERLLGPDAALTLESRWQIADALYSQQKYAEAEQEYRTAVAAYVRLEEKHGYTAYCRIRLAHTLAAQGRDGEAEQQHRARLKLYEQALAAGNPDQLAQCQKNTLPHTMNWPSASIGRRTNCTQRARSNKRGIWAPRHRARLKTFLSAPSEESPARARRRCSNGS